MVILFTVVTIKNRRRIESKPGFIWRTTAKVGVKLRPVRRFRELCNFSRTQDTLFPICKNITVLSSLFFLRFTSLKTFQGLTCSACQKCEVAGSIR